MIQFVRAGQIPVKRPRHKDFGLLEQARDWICDFDLPEFHSTASYRFPYNIDIESLRCDGYIVSPSLKVCLILELTAPMEENIETWHRDKLEKYNQISSPDWSFHYLIFEVGCRGFIPSRFFGLVRKLGFNSQESRHLRDNLQLVVRKCSYVIWVNRYNKEFQCSRILQTTIEKDPPPDDSSPPSEDVKVRIFKNRELAKQRLCLKQSRSFSFVQCPAPALLLSSSDQARISQNHEMAKQKLRLKKSRLTWRIVQPHIPSSSSALPDRQVGASQSNNSLSTIPALETKSTVLSHPILDLEIQKDGGGVFPLWTLVVIVRLFL